MTSCMARGGLGRDESGLATHELDQPDAHVHARGFDMGALDGLGGLLHCGVESKSAGDEVDVIVNGLGDADDRNLAPAPFHLVHDGLGRAQWCRRRR